jgi:hypothetical protein
MCVVAVVVVVVVVVVLLLLFETPSSCDIHGPQDGFGCFQRFDPGEWNLVVRVQCTETAHDVHLFVQMQTVRASYLAKSTQNVCRRCCAECEGKKFLLERLPELREPILPVCLDASKKRKPVSGDHWMRY